MEEHVVVVKSQGNVCFVCSKKVERHETAIGIRIKVPVVLTTTTVARDIHVPCARELKNLLDLRIAEAARGH